MTAKPPCTIRHLSLDQADATYRACLTLMRFCQLYAFWLLLEIAIRPLLFMNQWLAYGVGYVQAMLAGYAPGPTPDPDYLTEYVRTLWDIPILALVWIGFAYLSRMRMPFAILIVGVIVILFNLARSYHQFIVEEGGVLHDLAGLDIPSSSNLPTAISLTERMIFAGWAIFHIQFLYVCFRSFRLTRAVGSNAHISEHRRGAPFVTATTRSLLYLPAAMTHARRKVMTSALMIFAGLANVVNYWLFVMAWLLTCLIGLTVWILFDTSFPVGFPAAWADDPANAVFGLGQIALGCVVIAGVVLTVGWYLKFLIARAVRFARKFMHRSLTQAQDDDPRAPILFLRSFLDDQVSLRPRRLTLEQWQFDGTSRNLTLDHLIAEEGVPFGPTVALGNPDDPAPPYGVARGYFDHEDWQEAAARLCADASAIIFVLDRTEGVAWEINHIAAQEYASKTLFLLAPGDVGQPGENLLMRVLSRMGFGAGEAQAALAEPNIFAMEVSDSGSVTMLTLTDRSAYGYLIAVRRFLRDRLDANRPALS